MAGDKETVRYIESRRSFQVIHNSRLSGKAPSRRHNAACFYLVLTSSPSLEPAQEIVGTTIHSITKQGGCIVSKKPVGTYAQVPYFHTQRWLHIFMKVVAHRHKTIYIIVSQRWLHSIVRAKAGVCLHAAALISTSCPQTCIRPGLIHSGTPTRRLTLHQSTVA